MPAEPYAAAHELGEEAAVALAALGYAGHDTGGDPVQTSVHPRETFELAESFVLAKGLAQRGQLDEARLLIERIEEREPGGVSARFLWAIYHAARGPGDPAALERAEEEYRAALALAPERAPIWRGLAAVHHQQGELLESLRCLRTAHRLAPVLTLLGREYEERRTEGRRAATRLEREGRAQEALALVSFLLEDEPEDPWLLARAEALRGAEEE